MAKIMGYKGELTVDGQRVLKRVDASYDITPQTGSTTSAGDGSAVPIETGEATSIDAKVTFNMIIDDNDSIVSTLLSKAATGDSVPITFKAFGSSTGLDADCIVSCKQGTPLKGEATMDITVEALSASDREPELNQ